MIIFRVNHSDVHVLLFIFSVTVTSLIQSFQLKSSIIQSPLQLTLRTLAELAQLVRWMTLNQEVPGSSLDMAIWEKNLLVLLDKALYLRLSWIMTTFCPSIMNGNGALEYVKHS